MRWIIVSNRLPFKQTDSGEIERSAGGLVTALSGVHSEAQQIWVGIAPDGITADNWHDLPASYQQDYSPVFIEPEQYDQYYNGLANDVFWPLFHYEGSLIKFDPVHWQAYQDVNQAIARNLAELIQPEDVIWIHDFHLFLLPQMLRDLGVQNHIGFFLHIPFPSSELFRQLPVRKQLLTGLLGADLIGFHDYAYLRHFGSTLLNVLSIDSNMSGFLWKGRSIQVGVYPVSIDTEHFQQAAQTDAVATCLKQYQEHQPYQNLILGVDRLDYSKGLGLKLQAFKALLENHPDLQGEVSLLQIAIPTRQDVEEYQHLRARFEQLVGEINGKYSRPNYVPVQYMYSSVSFEELLALYQLADVMLVTSRRDGMNLVALEYIVAQQKANPGVVVLSEFTGASSMLSDVLTINPWNAAETAEKINQALKMPVAERWQRICTMQAFLKQYTASDWAKTFMKDLVERPNHPHPAATESVFENQQLNPEIQAAFETPICLFLDYDGTLVPIEESPPLAVLPESSYQLLDKLANHPRLTLVIVSGRDGAFLRQQFQDLPISLAAEHGAAFFDHEQQEWVPLIWSAVDSWYPSAESIMQNYSARVPHSLVERKTYSIAWHYRQSPHDFAKYQARKLKEELEMGLSNLPVTVISGSKVIEARAVEANKGYFVRNYMESMHERQVNTTFIAIGDDTTDEDMMQALPPEKGIGIRVGPGPTQARYRLEQQADVLLFLERLLAHLESI